MNLVNFDCPEFGQINFVGEKLNDGNDFLIRSNCDRDSLDLLIFLDSRGVNRTFEASLAEKMIIHIQENRHYLLICRPLELTTWATLFNFLTLNKLNPKTIVTNMGFVDFTPKKELIVEDVISQVEVFMGKGVATSQFIENYASSSGEKIPIYSMSCSSAYKHNIETIIRKKSIFIINSPSLSPSIRIKRERPRSFFFNLEESNRFNRSIIGAHVFDFQAFDETHTYDGVHYTTLGNDLIFRGIRECL